MQPLPKRFSAHYLPALILLLLVFPQTAKGLDWSRWTMGVSGGLGGTGIEKDVTVDSVETTVSRSEGPGMLGVSANWAVRDRWVLSLEHRRGFRLGPFSLGVGFTSVGLNWYFLRAAPVVVSSDLDSYASFGTWSPFFGLSSGIASGSITRENQAVEEVSSSGVFFGAKAGVDYQLRPTLVLRSELTTSTTIFSSETENATLSEFGIMVGVIFRL